MSQPHFEGKCEDETCTPKSGNLESFGTPATLELDCRGQNTLHWGVLYIVGKALKCKCRKWPRMGHSDICSSSYGRKKGWESNWQFDSQPQKVENQPDPSVYRWSAAHRWKALEQSYKFSLDLVPIRGLSRELWAPKVPRVQIGTVSGLPRNRKSFGCRCGGVTQRILYGGRWWLPPSPGRGESSESVLPVACPNTKSVFKGELTNLWLVLL